MRLWYSVILSGMARDAVVGGIGTELLLSHTCQVRSSRAWCDPSHGFNSVCVRFAGASQELLFALAAWVSGKSGGVRAGRARLLTRYNVAGASAACAPTRARLTTHCCQ